MTSQSRRLFLRESTSTAHARLDATVGPLDTLEAYRRYLAGQFLFRKPLEEQLRRAGWPVGLEQPLWIADLIEADMADLGVAAPEPAGPAGPPPHGIDELLGVLYVLEGSSFGARLLYGQARALGLSDIRGARHLARQSANTDGWRNFLSALESAVMPDGMGRCVGSSVATFARAERAFGSVADVVA